jgi:hypothetical protein
MMTDRFRPINWFKRPGPITNTKPFGKYLRSSRTDRAHRETVLQPKAGARPPAQPGALDPTAITSTLATVDSSDISPLTHYESAGSRRPDMAAKKKSMEPIARAAAEGVAIALAARQPRFRKPFKITCV